jgi:hypothetical protein
MKEITISSLDDVFNFVNEYSNKKLFFRGENKNYEKTSCLPESLRGNSVREININYVGDSENDWFTKKLVTMVIGTPYWPSKGDSTNDVIINALLNTPSWSWKLWDEEKLEAIMKHYSFDFKRLKDFMIKTDLERIGACFFSSYLDITSDIMTALHFACSQFCFYRKDEEIPHEAKTSGDGYLFVFDLSGIGNAKYLKLVNNPSYAYFYKKCDEVYFQPFDRITHQRGAFLAPKKDEKNTIIYEELKKEITEIYLTGKIIIKNNVKRELFKIFGGKNGLNYYFPKIPLLMSDNNDAIMAYKNLEGITLLEKATPG